MSDKETTFDDLPQSWQHKIRELRKDAAKMRRERNEARDALAELAMKVAGLAEAGR